MRRIVVTPIATYWMLAFGLLAAGALGESGGAGFGPVMRLASLGLEEHVIHRIAGAEMRFGLAVGFAVVSAMFAWLLVSALTEGEEGRQGTDEVSRMAFGGSVGLLAALLVAGSIVGAEGMLASTGIQLCALLASFVAVQLDRREEREMPDTAGRDGKQAARLMALGAVHSSLLSRIRTDGPDVDEEPR